MMKPPPKTDDEDALQREAQQWLIRLNSGEATTADAEALQRWRLTSRDHRRAFAEASLLWTKLGSAATETSRRTVKQAAATGRHRSATGRVALGRRAFLGGAIAATAAASAYVVVNPPLELWPSLTDMRADYRTGVGEQRVVAVQEDVSVRLNTRSSLAILQQASQADGIELLSGEAAIEIAPNNRRAFALVAAHGRTLAQNARFNIRYDGSSVRVTCLEGAVEVEHLGRRASVASHRQVVYASHGMSDVTNADADSVTAWERGVLVFRNDPLAHVVEEINRYRPGRIILMNEELGRKSVLATFRLDRIDEAVPRLQAAFGVKTRNLPGGIVLVS